MDEQRIAVEQLNDFLRRRGLKANFLAEQLGISTSVMYNFKSGSALLTQRQLQKLLNYIEDYDRKLGGLDAGGVG